MHEKETLQKHRNIDLFNIKMYIVYIIFILTSISFQFRLFFFNFVSFCIYFNRIQKAENDVNGGKWCTYLIKVSIANLSNG